MPANFLKHLQKKSKFIGIALILGVLLTAPNVNAALSWDTPADGTQVLNAARWNLMVSKIIEINQATNETLNKINDLTIPVNTLSGSASGLGTSITTASGNIINLNTDYNSKNSDYLDKKSKFETLSGVIHAKTSATSAYEEYVTKTGGVLTGSLIANELQLGEYDNYVYGNNDGLNFVSDKTTVTGPQFIWMGVNGTYRAVLDLNLSYLGIRNSISFVNNGGTANDGKIGPELINPSGLDINGIGSVGDRKINIFGQLTAYNDLITFNAVFGKYQFGVSGNNVSLEGTSSGIVLTMENESSKFRVTNGSGDTVASIDGQGNFEKLSGSGDVLTSINSKDSDVTTSGPSIRTISKDNSNLYADWFKIISNDGLGSSSERGISFLYMTNQVGNTNECGPYLGVLAQGCKKIMTVTSGFNGTTTNRSKTSINGNMVVGTENSFTGDTVSFKGNLSLSGVLTLGNLENDPSTGISGQIYLNSVTGKMRCYSTEWKDCGGVAQITQGQFLEKSNYSSLVYNGDFEYSSGSTGANGVIGNADFGWYVTTSGGSKASYDESIKYEGNKSLRLEIPKVGGYIELNQEPVTYRNKQTLSLNLKPSTTYVFNYAYKTNYVSGDSTGFLGKVMLSDDANTNRGSFPCMSAVKTSVDWSECTTEFTTPANVTVGHVRFLIYGHQGAGNLIMSARIDNVRVTEKGVTLPTVNIGTPTSGEICLGRWCSAKRNGTSKDNAGFDCSQIKTEYPNSANGTYRIKPLPTKPAVQVTCDMTSDEYGWTKIVDEGTFVGEQYTNAIFGNGKNKILKYAVGSTIRAYYKRINYFPGNFSNDILKFWKSTNNVLGTDFNMYSSLANLKDGTSAWTTCDYDDNLVGFPRDCGPTGLVLSKRLDGGRGTLGTVGATATKGNMWIATIPKPISESLFASCAEIKSANPASPDGNYRIQPAGWGTPMNVYCDMTTEGGGWTRVVRINSTNVSPNVDTVFSAEQNYIVQNVTSNKMMFKSKVTAHVQGGDGSFATFATINPTVVTGNIDNVVNLPYGTIETNYLIFDAGTMTQKRLNSTMGGVPASSAIVRLPSLAEWKKIKMFRTNGHYWSNFASNRFNTDTGTIDYAEMYVK